jgi:hypothetical protein
LAKSAAGMNATSTSDGSLRRAASQAGSTSISAVIGDGVARGVAMAAGAPASQMAPNPAPSAWRRVNPGGSDLDVRDMDWLP